MEVDEEGIAPLWLSPLGEETQLHLFALRDLPDQCIERTYRPGLGGESLGISPAPQLPHTLLLCWIVLWGDVVGIAGFGSVLCSIRIYLLS